MPDRSDSPSRVRWPPIQLGLAGGMTLLLLGCSARFVAADAPGLPVTFLWPVPSGTFVPGTSLTLTITSELAMDQARIADTAVSGDVAQPTLETETLTAANGLTSLQVLSKTVHTGEKFSLALIGKTPSGCTGELAYSGTATFQDVQIVLSALPTCTLAGADLVDGPAPGLISDTPAGLPSATPTPTPSSTPTPAASPR